MFINKKTIIIMFSLIILTLFTSVHAESFIVKGDSYPSTITSGLILPFSEGVFSRTRYYSGPDVVKIITGTTWGDYESPIFPLPQNATLENISWATTAIYGKELLNSKASENGPGGINMNNNVLLMHMNEASGQINDYSGSGNDGTTYGGITYSSSGILNNALSFDGNDDYISVDDDSSLDCSANSRTYCAWVNIPNDISGGSGTIRSIMSKYPQSGGQPRFDFYVYKNTGLPNFVIEGYLNGMVDRVEGTTNLRGNGWSLVCFVRDRTSDILRIYVNGVEEGIANDRDYDAHNNGKLKIGQYQDGTSGREFKGKIDEVSIFTRALSTQEIKDMYIRGITKLDMQVRSCTAHDCNGDAFIDIPDDSPQSLKNISTKNYFMFRLLFNTEDAAFSPEVKNVSVSFSIKDTKPNLNIYPLRVDEDTQIREPTIDLWKMASDIHTPIDKLKFKIESQSSGILDCNLKNNQFIECDPVLNANGNKTLRISVTDESNNTAYGNMTITVNPFNDLPTITNLPVNLNAKEGEIVRFDKVEAYDVEDGNSLRYFIKFNFKNATINNNGNFYWTPGYDDAGSHDFEIMAMDVNGGIDTGIIHIDVEDAPGPDLAIEQVDVMDLPNEKIFSFFVKNRGNKEVNDFEYKIEDGLGKTYKETASMPHPLGMNEEMIINYKVNYKSYSPGKIGFAKVIIDPDNKIREEDENNNEVADIPIAV